MSPFVRTRSPKHVDYSRRPYLFAGAAFASAGLLATAGLIPLTGGASFAGISGCALTLDGDGDRADLQTLLSNASCTTVTVNRAAGHDSIAVDQTLTLAVSDNVTRTLIGNGVELLGSNARRILDITSDAAGKTFIDGVKFTQGRSLGASDDGGAIRTTSGLLELSDTAFVSNRVGRLGGAIYAASADVNVYDSYFENNQGDEGGSIYNLGGDVFIVNSTFTRSYDVGQVGLSEANVFAEFGDVTTVLSTFVDSYSGTTGTAMRGESVALYGSQVVNTSQAATFNPITGTITDFGGNVYSGNPTITTPGTGTIRGVANSGLAETASLNSPGTTETFALSDGVAVDIVPVLIGSALATLSARYPAAAGSFVMPTTDQRGVTRTAPFDSGAYEFGTTLLGGGSSSSPSSPSPFMPVVLSVTPTKITIENEIVTLFGAGLNSLTEVWVNGKKTEVVMVSPNRITFRSPSGLSGTYSITLRGGGYELLAPESLVYASVAASNRARTVVPGFAANSIVLSNTMKKEIRQFVRANPGFGTVVCKGYTSLPVTPQDAALSRGRGQATCDYIKTLNPDLTVVLREGSHTNKPGLPIRRVQITLR